MSAHPRQPLGKPPGAPVAHFSAAGQGNGLPAGDPAFLTPRETAALLRRSVKALYRMLDADPTFPRTKLPSGGLLFPRLALERYLRDRTEGMRGPLHLAAVAPACEPSSTHAPADALKP